MAKSNVSVVYDNPAMEYEDDTIHPPHEPKSQSQNAIGQYSSVVNQSSSVTHQESRAEVQLQPTVLIRRDNCRKESPTRIGQFGTNEEPVQLLRVTELRDTNVQNLARCSENEEIQKALEQFVSKKQGNDGRKHKSRKVRSFYEKQDKLIAAFEDLSKRKSFDDDTDSLGSGGPHGGGANRRDLAALFSKITLAVNLVLLCAKLVASILSSSMSIISSLVDSAVDLLSGIILWWAARAIRTRNPYLYPQGRTKLEPLSIVILSVVMGLASVQIIRESAEKVMQLINDRSDLPSMELATFILAGSTVVVKFVLWLVCRRVNSPIVRALAMDHRNDILSNTVAIICGYLGSRNFQEETRVTGFVFTDPLGAILISCYIIYNWWITGCEQIRLLTGHTASQDFLSQLTWIAMHHDPLITHVDTLAAYHYGNNFMVKADIVLPETTNLKDAHDIGESLQRKFESIPEVERAFVHIDYEFRHKPSSEHKVI